MFKDTKLTKKERDDAISDRYVICVELFENGIHNNIHDIKVTVGKKYYVGVAYSNGIEILNRNHLESLSYWFHDDTGRLVLVDCKYFQTVEEYRSKKLENLLEI